MRMFVCYMQVPNSETKGIEKPKRPHNFPMVNEPVISNKGQIVRFRISQAWVEGHIICDKWLGQDIFLIFTGIIMWLLLLLLQLWRFTDSWSWPSASDHEWTDWLWYRWEWISDALAEFSTNAQEERHVLSVRCVDRRLLKVCVWAAFPTFAAFLYPVYTMKQQWSWLTECTARRVQAVMRSLSQLHRVLLWCCVCSKSTFHYHLECIMPKLSVQNFIQIRSDLTLLLYDV